MGISRKRRLEALETQVPTSEEEPWAVPPARRRAIRRLRLEDPHAIELVQNVILRHERQGGPPVDTEGLLMLTDLSDEELKAFGRLTELRDEAMEEEHDEPWDVL